MLEQRAQRRGIKQATHLGRAGHAARHQPSSPTQNVSPEGKGTDMEDLIDRELAPQAGELIDRLRERTRICRQIGHVDRPR